MTQHAYAYRGFEKGGATRRGTVVACTERDAYRKLATEGLTPTEISLVRESGATPTFSSQRINSNDISAFTRELAVLLSANIPLARGLAGMAEQAPKPLMAAMIRRLSNGVESGRKLTEALSEEPAGFDDVYIETIRAAEKTGTLAEVVTMLADLLERQFEARQQLRRALTYPVVVMGVVAIAVTVIFVFVVPRFAATFASQGMKLPFITRVVQAIGYSVQSYWWVYAGVAAAGLCAVVLTWRHPAGRIKIERALIASPIIGPMLVADAASRFVSVLAVGLGSGLDLIESFRIAGRATGRHALREQTESVADGLLAGKDIGEALSKATLVPSFARRMLIAGKDAKELSRACGVVSRHYERESAHLMKNINTVIEPLLTVALAAIVLVVALSVFVPMWEMVKVKH